MAYDISGFGLRVQLSASVTYPQGVTISQFADDADPFDTPSIQLADKAIGLNGDLIIFAKAVPLGVTINVIPGSDDARALDALAEANRVGKGKTRAADVITMTAIYPDGRTLTMTGGAITDAMPGDSVASAGRLKSKAYMFAFENRQSS